MQISCGRSSSRYFQTR